MQVPLPSGRTVFIHDDQVQVRRLVFQQEGEPLVDLGRSDVVVIVEDEDDAAFWQALGSGCELVEKWAEDGLGGR